MSPLLVADLVPQGDPDLTIFIAIMFAGFAVGIAGHIYRSKAAIVAGIAPIFLATLILPLIVFGTGN